MRWLNYILPLSTLTVLPLILVVKEPNREGSWPRKCAESLFLQQMKMEFHLVPNHIEYWLQKLKQDYTFSYTLLNFAFENATMKLALKACDCKRLMSTTWIKSDTCVYKCCVLTFPLLEKSGITSYMKSLPFLWQGQMYCKRKSEVWLHLRQLSPLIESPPVPTVFCSDQPETSAFLSDKCRHLIKRPLSCFSNF